MFFAAPAIVQESHASFVHNSNVAAVRAWLRGAAMQGPDPELLSRQLGCAGFASDPLFATAQWAIRILFVPTATSEFALTCWYVDPDVRLRMSVALRRLSDLAPDAASTSSANPQST
ncbi:MAG TPA: hypothetical protein VL860_02005, partial [Planctomycetota bacterium]|nr:hypothetical protein [Planctomycetota bacterium]